MSLGDFMSPEPDNGQSSRNRSHRATVPRVDRPHLLVREEVSERDERTRENTGEIQGLESQEKIVWNSLVRFHGLHIVRDCGRRLEPDRDGELPVGGGRLNSNAVDVGDRFGRARVSGVYRSHS